MSGTFTVSRSHLIYGLTIPLALVLGFMLAEPMDSSSVAVVVMVFSVLAAPLLIKWHHPVLVFSWNTVFYLGFMPGSPPLWMLMAGLGFVFVWLNRCLGNTSRVIVGGQVGWSLVFLALVVAGTAMATGGITLWSLGGSGAAGGKKYFFIWAAIMGYFVLASKRIPPERAVWLTGLFFLPGMTAILSDLLFMAGKSVSWLSLVIPMGGHSQAAAERSGLGGDTIRVTGWAVTATSVCYFLVFRYGIRGLVDMRKPLRFLLLAGILAAGMLGGFRSFLITIGLFFAVVFFLEGLHRTRYMVILLATALVGLGTLTAVVDKLPFAMQRSLSFLPIEINSAAKQDAQGSLEWRVEMWRVLLPEVPQYLLKGKGYVMNVSDLFLAFENANRLGTYDAESAAVAGDYHNGPLSVLIPFGLWGALAFGWFLVAATRMLYRNYKYGDARLISINRALLACFVAKIIFFLFVFGAISSDIAYFVGLAGLSFCLNGDLRQPVAPQSMSDGLV